MVLLPNGTFEFSTALAVILFSSSAKRGGRVRKVSARERGGNTPEISTGFPQAIDKGKKGV